MKEFELKIDINTPYIKTIRFIGVLTLGIFIGFILIKFKTATAIDWMNIFTGVTFGIFFAFFPGAAKKQSLFIDKEGIHTHHYKFHWGERNKIKWENISAIEVDRSKIRIKNSIGSYEKIPLPLYTKEQISSLKTYLREVTTAKQIEYLA